MEHGPLEDVFPCYVSLPEGTTIRLFHHQFVLWICSFFHCEVEFCSPESQSSFSIGIPQPLPHSTDLLACLKQCERWGSMKSWLAERHWIRCIDINIIITRVILIGTWTFQRVPNGSERVSIYHPLGFNWHPLEGAGTLIWIWYCTKIWLHGADLHLGTITCHNISLLMHGEPRLG